MAPRRKNLGPGKLTLRALGQKRKSARRLAKGHVHGFLEAHQSTVARIASQRPPGFWADAAIGSFGIYEGARRMERKLTETATDLGSHRKRNEGGDGHGNEAHRHGHGHLGCRSGAEARRKSDEDGDGDGGGWNGRHPTRPRAHDIPNSSV